MEFITYIAKTVFGLLEIKTKLKNQSFFCKFQQVLLHYRTLTRKGLRPLFLPKYTQNCHFYSKEQNNLKIVFLFLHI